MSQPFPKRSDDPPAARTATPAMPQEPTLSPFIIQAPKSSLMGRILMGLFTTVVLTIFTNSVGFKSIVTHFLASVVAIFGGKHHEVKTRSENDRRSAAANAERIFLPTQEVNSHEPTLPQADR